MMDQPTRQGGIIGVQGATEADALQAPSETNGMMQCARKVAL